MKLTVLLPQGLQDPSGSGRYWPLAKEMAKLDHAVTLLCLHPNMAACEQRVFDAAGVHVEYVAPMHVQKSGGSKRYYPAWQLPLIVARGIFAMSRALRQHKADAYLVAKALPTNSLASFTDPAIWREGRVYADCDDYEAGSNNFQSGWQRYLVGQVEDRLVRRVRKVSVNTHFTADRLCKLGIAADKIVMVPNGVDRQRLLDMPAGFAEKLRAAQGLTGKQLAVYVGSLSLANHAVDILLEAGSIAAKQMPNLHLAIVGGGEDFGRLKELSSRLGLQEHVTFTGRVSAGEALGWLAAADLAIDPARDDLAHRGRAPLKIVEAMAVGTPVLTSAIGDRADVLGNGSAGYLAAAGDSTALAQGLVTAFADSDMLADKARMAKVLVENYYWDVLVHRFLTLFKE